VPKPPRIPGSRVVWIGGRPVALSEKEYRELLSAYDGKRKGKMKSAADKAWEEEGKKRAKPSK
jgi:hypothetical protein